MALTEEEVYELSKGEEFGYDVPDDERREMARDVIARIARTQPEELTSGVEVMNPRYPMSLTFVEYRGERSLVRGFPLGANVDENGDEPSEFEVPSDEILVLPEHDVAVVAIMIEGPELEELYGGWVPPEPDEKIH